MIMFDPISLISAWMLRFDPCPMASIVMTDATPMMMPSIVRNPRSLLLLERLDGYSEQIGEIHRLLLLFGQLRQGVGCA